MPNAIVMTGYGPPEVLKWAEVPLREPAEVTDQDRGQGRRRQPDRSRPARRLSQGHPAGPLTPLLGFEATQLAAAPGVKVISAVGEHDETLAVTAGRPRRTSPPAAPVNYRLGSDRGSANHGSTLFSKRVMAQIRSPLRVRT
jgi:hypothetical protein